MRINNLIPNSRSSFIVVDSDNSKSQCNMGKNYLYRIETSTKLKIDAYIVYIKIHVIILFESTTT